jgi:hypothetical protein
MKRPPECFADSPEIAIITQNKSEILNDPKFIAGEKRGTERSSFVREFMLAHDEIVALSIYVKIWVTRKVNGLVVPDETGEAIRDPRYITPEPDDSGNLPDMIWEAVYDHCGRRDMQLTPQVKQLAQDWWLIFAPESTVANWPWETMKAGGVSNQPGDPCIEDIDVEVKVVDNKEPQYDGCMRVTQDTLDLIAMAFGRPEGLTWIKLSGCWPHSSKLVIYVDPNMPEPDEYVYAVGNDKGTHRELTDEGILSMKDFRIVSDSRSYYKKGVTLSWQVLSMAENWREVAEEYVKPQFELLRGVAQLEAGALQDAMSLSDIFVPGPGLMMTEDGARRKWFQTAEPLLASGATPKSHPFVKKAAEIAMHWMREDLQSGIHIDSGFMACALPSEACRKGEVIVPKSLYKWLCAKMETDKPYGSFGRYPFNQPGEVQHVRVRYNWRKSKAFGRAVYVNAEDWRKFSNGDFDQDLGFFFGVPMQFQAIEHQELTTEDKGTITRTSRSHFDEAYKAFTSAAAVGAVCNRLLVLRAIRACFRLDTIELEKLGAEAYHKIIQAVKNNDFDHRPFMAESAKYISDNLRWIDKKDFPEAFVGMHANKRVVRTQDLTSEQFGRSVGMEAKLPFNEGRQTKDRTAEGFNNRIKFFQQVDSGWEPCLHGWVCKQFADIGLCPETALPEVNRAQIIAAIKEEDLFPHELSTDLLVSEFLTSYRTVVRAAIEETKMRRASNPHAEMIKPDLTEVHSKADQIKVLDPTERDAAIVLVGREIVAAWQDAETMESRLRNSGRDNWKRTRMSTLPLDMIVWAGKGTIGERLYSAPGGRPLDPVEGQIRRWAQVEAESEESDDAQQAAE